MTALGIVAAVWALLIGAVLLFGRRLNDVRGRDVAFTVPDSLACPTSGCLLMVDHAGVCETQADRDAAVLQTADEAANELGPDEHWRLP